MLRFSVECRLLRVESQDSRFWTRKAGKGPWFVAPWIERQFFILNLLAGIGFWLASLAGISILLRVVYPDHATLGRARPLAYPVYVGCVTWDFAHFTLKGCRRRFLTRKCPFNWSQDPDKSKFWTNIRLNQGWQGFAL